MRLWHKDLIPMLPKQQLLGQWRECCAIARNIAMKGTPNHILVNKIMDYPLDHFVQYQYLVWKEMKNRGFEPNDRKFYKWIPDKAYKHIDLPDLFNGWHNDRYFNQCIMNLQEKADCGGIDWAEWVRLLKTVGYLK